MLTSCQDKDDVLAAVKRNGDLLEYASESLRNDKEVVLVAIKSYNCLASPLQYASAPLKDDRQIVSASAKHNPCFTLQHASERLQDDEEIVMDVVVKSSGTAFRHASKRLKDNKEIAKMAILLSRFSAFETYQLCSRTVQQDEEVIACLASRGETRRE